MPKKNKPTTATTEPNVEAVKAAIAAGKALIDEGKTKTEAAMAIYIQIEGESQETIVNRSIHSALRFADRIILSRGLTPGGIGFRRTWIDARARSAYHARPTPDPERTSPWRAPHEPVLGRGTRRA